MYFIRMSKRVIQICKELGSLIDVESMMVDYQNMMSNIHIHDVSFIEVETEVGDIDVLYPHAVVNCKMGDHEIPVHETCSFKIPFDSILLQWCSDFVDKNFGLNKPVKTFNVTKSTLMYSKINSFPNWVKENIDVSFMEDNKKHRLYSHVILTRQRVNEEVQKFLRSEEIQTRKQEFIDRIAAEQIKLVVMKYPTASPDSFHEAVRLGVAHSVLSQ